MKTTLENLQALRDQLMKKPSSNSTKWHKIIDVKYDTGRVLRQNGIIKNYGSKRNPTWHWVGAEPSQELLDNVLNWERTFLQNKYESQANHEVRNEKRIEGFKLDVIIPHLSCYTKNGAKVEFFQDSVVLNKNGHDLKINDQDTLMKLINMI